jgi:SSS family solute:Na+ symporter
VAALIACIVAVFAIGVGMWALALTLETYIGWPIWLGILVSGTVVGFYSISGGLAAVAITDSLQVCIMFLCGLIIVYLGLEGLGGWDNFASQLTEEHPTHLQTYLPVDHESYPWPGVILGLGLVLSPAYWIGSQAILQRSLGAKSQWDASASMMFAAFAKTLVPLLIVFPGILALVMKADIDYPDMALPWIIKNVLPAGISGLMFVAIIAALQSTIDSGINSTSLMITRDIRHVLLNDDSTENDLKIGRYLTLLILVIAMSIAPFIGELGGIFTFMQTVLSLFQGPMLALLLLGALSKRATPQAGLWTLITGVPVAGIFLLLGMNMLYVAFVTFCYSMIVLWLVSGVTKGLAEDQLDRLTYLTWRR